MSRSCRKPDSWCRWVTNFNEADGCKGLLVYTVILANNGRHKEAAFLFMEAGKFKDAAREHGEILDHEKVLATLHYAGLLNELIVYLERYCIFHIR
jgi:hypothetical protein